MCVIVFGAIFVIVFVNVANSLKYAAHDATKESTIFGVVNKALNIPFNRCVHIHVLHSSAAKAKEFHRIEPIT